MDNQSPRDSVVSHANSAYSQAGSTRHMLAGMNNSGDYGNGGLLTPRTPWANNPSRENLSVGSASGSNLSLSLNYLPQKFSASIISPGGTRFRGKASDGPSFPKRGGGRDAFKSSEARMGTKKMKWTKFKWILFFTNTLLLLYSLAALVMCLVTWFNVWENADVVRVGNRTELILSTFACCVGLLTSVIGWAGILLNNRAFLAWYTFLSWITFAFLLVPGYITYKKRTFNLEGKINAQWSQALGTVGRMKIQNELQCCGYFSPYIEATVTQTCYSRSVLPGCKAPYIEFEKVILLRWFTAVFLLVPLQMTVMIAGLLCSNHITYRFGKGMMPEAYRLNMGTMALIMDQYANQLAEQYGSDVAADILSKSRSNLQLDSLPSLSYSGSGSAVPLSGASSKFGPNHQKYDSLANRPPDTPL